MRKNCRREKGHSVIPIAGVPPSATLFQTPSPAAPLRVMQLSPKSARSLGTRLRLQNRNQSHPHVSKPSGASLPHWTRSRGNKSRVVRCGRPPLRLRLMDRDVPATSLTRLEPTLTCTCGRQGEGVEECARHAGAKSSASGDLRTVRMCCGGHALVHVAPLLPLLWEVTTWYRAAPAVTPFCQKPWHCFQNFRR